MKPAMINHTKISEYKSNKENNFKNQQKKRNKLHKNKHRWTSHSLLGHQTGWLLMQLLVLAGKVFPKQHFFFFLSFALESLCLCLSCEHLFSSNSKEQNKRGTSASAKSHTAVLQRLQRDVALVNAHLFWNTLFLCLSHTVSLSCALFYSSCVLTLISGMDSHSPCKFLSLRGEEKHWKCLF